MHKSDIKAEAEIAARKKKPSAHYWLNTVKERDEKMLGFVGMAG